MPGSYANCTRFLWIHTHVLSHKPISALSAVAHDDMCFPAVRQPRWCRISRSISWKGRISARYRRAQILIQSTCIYIDALATPRGWNCAATANTRRYTRAILSDLSWATRCTLFRNVRFGNLWDIRFARLTHHSICVAHFNTSLHRLICDGDIRVPYSLTVDNLMKGY